MTTVDITKPDNGADTVITLKISGNRLVAICNAVQAMAHETGKDQHAWYQELNEVIERVRDQLSEQRMATNFPPKPKRHRDALTIQGGACNPSGIALSIVDACREIRRDPGTGTAQITGDPAVRLMVHQLAFICRADDARLGPEYDALTRACEEGANEHA